MKENRCVIYRIFFGFNDEQNSFLNRFQMQEDECENRRERMHELFSKLTKDHPHPVDFFAADFGARCEPLPTGKYHITGGLIVLAAAIDGVEQPMTTYNLASGMSMEDIESKKNYKTNLTPYETVDEIKCSSDRFFLVTTDDPRFPDQLIDTEQLDSELPMLLYSTDLEIYMEKEGRENNKDIKDEADNFRLRYIFTKEHRIKKFRLDTMLLTKNTWRNLKAAGFNNLYDIIENPYEALKAVGTDEEEIIKFYKAICFCWQHFQLLPENFDYRLVFTEDTINKVREAIEKDKLEILSEEDCEGDRG